jgi:hypothetical protein
MPIESPESRVRWIHVPISGELEITFLSRGETWWSHWTKSGSRRCVKERCPHCTGGDQPTARYVYLVKDAHGEGFIELGGSQFGALERIESMGAVGVQVRMYRERARRNSLILIEVEGQEEGLPVRDIRDFAKSLGTR